MVDLHFLDFPILLKISRIGFLDYEARFVFPRNVWPIWPIRLGVQIFWGKSQTLFCTVNKYPMKKDE